jgi:Tol biopolymer transport system component
LKANRDKTEISFPDDRFPRRFFRLPGLSLFLALLVTGCSFSNSNVSPGTVNGRWSDEEPSLSGDGRWLAFVSNRSGNQRIWLYDLQERHYEELAGLYAGQEIVDSPSLSRTGRYLVYRVTIEGRPVIALHDRLTRRSELVTQNYRGAVRNPSISPDGRYIVFEAARKGQWDIETLDRGSNIELDIPEGTPVENPNP